MLAALILAMGSLCSLGAHSGRVEPGRPHLVARATADTVLAGPGRFVAPQGGLIYGQVFEVERVGGDGIPAGLRPGARIVLVPWAYGADCRPTPWHQSSRFIPAGEAFFVQVAFRDSSAWVAGMHTADLSHKLPVSTASTWDGLAAEQVFEIFEQLPRTEEIERDGWAALQKIRRWGIEHPDVAGRLPVRRMFENLAQQAELVRLASEPSPLFGTWDVRVALATHREVRLWIRTATVPVTFGLTFWTGDREQENKDPWSFRARGSELHFWAAADSADLPAAGVPASTGAYYPIEVSDRDSSIGDSRVRSAMLEIGKATWPSDIDQETSELFERYADLKVEEARAAGWKYSPPLGRITQSPDSVVTFEQILELGPRVVIRARRISRETVAGNGYPRR